MRWRRSLRNGIVLGVVLVFHGGVALFLLADRSGLRTRSFALSTPRGHVLQVELLPPSPSRPLAAHAARQRGMAARISSAGHVRVHHRPSMENEHAPPATIEPVGHVENALNLQLPAKGTAGNFANHAWQQAMGYTQAPPPRLPGAAAGQTVRHIALIPRKAIKARVEEIGKFMNCSIAIIKRHAQSDTPQRINLAHDASGCTK